MARVIIKDPNSLLMLCLYRAKIAKQSIFGKVKLDFVQRLYKTPLYVPIVAFLTNATKKNATIVFAFQPKVEFVKLGFQKESN